jgi:hypothetical protein
MQLVDTPIAPMDPSIADVVNKLFIGFEYNKETDSASPPSSLSGFII